MPKRQSLLDWAKDAKPAGPTSCVTCTHLRAKGVLDDVNAVLGQIARGEVGVSLAQLFQKLRDEYELPIRREDTFRNHLRRCLPKDYKVFVERRDNARSI